MNKRYRVFLLILIGLFLISGISVVSVESYTSRPDFCGSCHIMQKPFKSWKNSEHGAEGVACVECHYAPGEKATWRSKFRGLGQLFTYVSTDDKEVRKRTTVEDRSCLQSDCHETSKFFDKTFQYAEGVRFIHKPHMEKQIEGQTLHCNTCHQHVGDTSHFEVPKTSCYLCHFKKSKFNRERSKCKLCHELPTKSLQSQKKVSKSKSQGKVITHQSLEKSGVLCDSCHHEMIIGKGNVKSLACEVCHDGKETLAKRNNKKVMHQEHVAEQHANCFDCHEPIMHRETAFLDPVRKNCDSCHPNHHSFQKALLVGKAMGGVTETPSLMDHARTNCLGCHNQKKIRKGEVVFFADERACVKCHTKEHARMLDRWEKDLQASFKSFRELQAEVKSEMNKKGVSSKMKAQARKILKAARSKLAMVENGNGIHNKKYSLLLINDAVISFEDWLDQLEGSE